MDYKIEGNEYTSPDFDANEFAREMIEECEKSGFQWQQIRMDRDGCVYAFTQTVGVSAGNVLWLYDGENYLAKFLTRLDGDEVSWQDFGIIRAEPETKKDNMNYKIAGTEGYNPHHSHMENIAAGLVSDATARCDDWKEIRIDYDGGTFAYNALPWPDKRGWDFEDGEAFKLTNLSTELEVGLNWQTFGIIRTEEAGEAVPELIRLSENLWQHAHVEQPERTIAERQLWADEFASMIFAEVREMTKLQETVTLTPALITALSDWPDSALDIIAQAIADGRIVLQ